MVLRQAGVTAQAILPRNLANIFLINLGEWQSTQLKAFIAQYPSISYILS
jgi:hypothetical protein